MPKNTKKGSPRYGKTYKVGKGGSHVYNIKGKRVVIGGKKKAKPKKKVDPYKAEVDSAVALEFGDTDLQIDRERRISRQAYTNADAAWAGYQRDLAAAAQRQNAGYQQAQQGVYNQANTARQQDQSQAAQLDAEAQRQAALRGTTATPSVAASAQANRQAQTSSFGGLVGAQGAAQNSYMADQYRIGGGIRALELGKEAGRGRTIEETARGVAAKKGAYRVAKRSELISAEQKAQLEAAAFGLDQLKTASQIQDRETDNQRQSREARERARANRERESNTRRGQNVTRRGQDLTDRRARENAAKKGGGKNGGMTPTQRRAARKDYEKAVGELRSVRYGSKKGPSMPDLLAKNPKKWRRYAIRKLQPRYGHKVAAKAVDRVIATGRKKSPAWKGIKKQAKGKPKGALW